MSEPVCRTLEDGTQVWRLNGHLHRTDGPAVINADGTEAWFLNGLLHRADGPARIYPNGRQDWWIEGRELTRQEVELLRFRRWALEGELV